MATQSMEDLMALIDYHAQLGQYRHIQEACDKARPPPELATSVAFWRAFALSMEGSYDEALSAVELMLDQSDVALAACAVLISTHKAKAAAKGSGAAPNIGKYKERLKELSKQSAPPALQLAGRYFWHVGKLKQARQCAEKVLGQPGKAKDPAALCLFGWLNLTSGNARYEKKSLVLFDTAIKLSKGEELSARMGRARYYYVLKRNFAAALAELEDLCQSHPHFLPALAETARVHMLAGRWDEAYTVAHQVLRRDPQSLAGLQMVLLYLLAQECQPAAAVQRLNELSAAMDAREPRSATLYLRISALCARLCERRHALLQLCQGLVERARKLRPHDSAAVTEHAYQLGLLGEWGAALRAYEEATVIDESNSQALRGRLLCRIQLGQLEEAAQELSLLQEVTAGGAKGEQEPQLLHLSALLAWRKDHHGPRALSLLQRCLEQHIATCTTVEPGEAYLVAYNPAFILEVAGELLRHMSVDPRHASEPPCPRMRRCTRILSRLAAAVPGLPTAHLLLAQACLAGGDFKACDASLDAVFALEGQGVKALLLRARSCLAQKKFTPCAKALDEARATEYEVRSIPAFHLLRARLLRATGHLRDAVAILEAGLDLPGVSSPAGAGRRALPHAERAPLFLELVGVHSDMGHLDRADAVMEQAKVQFSGSGEAGRLVLREAALCVERRDLDGALALLRDGIEPRSPFRTQATIQSAGILLKYKRDRHGYAECYRKLAREDQSVHSQILLGAAYMHLQQPKRAIAAYNTALGINPDNLELVSCIGKALVSTHDYAQACQYYERMVSERGGQGGWRALVHDLARLYLKLCKHADAIRVLAGALGKAGDAGAADSEEDTMRDVETYLLLAKVHAAAQSREGQEKALQAAWERHHSLLTASSGNLEKKRAQGVIAADICHGRAKLCLEHGHGRDAEELYRQGLRWYSDHVPSRLALAKIYMREGDLDKCQEQCSALAKLEPHNAEATGMLARLLFRRARPEQAAHQFRQIFERNPSNYGALQKLLLMLHRAGRLAEEGPELLRMAERAPASRAPSRQQSHKQQVEEMQAGLQYCKGTAAWCMNKSREALEAFSQARRHTEWGTHALLNMVELYLSPDASKLFVDAVRSSKDDPQYTRNLESARKLLDELRGRSLRPSERARLRVLQGYDLMARSESKGVEDAEHMFSDILRRDRESVPAMLGVAVALALQGQSDQANAQLIDISRLTPDAESAKEYEQALLMQALSLLEQGKETQAAKLCEQCIKGNKACVKAWELLGRVAEEEQQHTLAADHLQQAWTHMSHSSPDVGFRLAYNMLKSRRYVQAIRVCHEVLEVDPDHPKIRQSVLEKARRTLRP